MPAPAPEFSRQFTFRVHRNYTFARARQSRAIAWRATLPSRQWIAVLSTPSLRPLFLHMPPVRRPDLDPIPRPPRLVRRVRALRHDALDSKGAGLLEQALPLLTHVLHWTNALRAL